MRPFDRSLRAPMHYLTFEVSESAEDVLALEAVAATTIAQHGAVMAEVRQVLDWAQREFPHAQGPIDEGMDWDHDLLVSVEGPWHTVALTLTGSPRFVEAFSAAFGNVLS